MTCRVNRATSISTLCFGASLAATHRPGRWAQHGTASATAWRVRRECRLSGWHQGGWVKGAGLKADRIKPDKWRATVLYQDGKAKRPRPLTVEDTSKEKAKTRIEARKEEEKGKVNSAPELGNRTVEEAATAYLEKLNAGKVRNTRTGEPASPSTVRTYRQVVTAYVLRPGSLIKGMKLSDVTAYDLGLEAEALIDDGKGSHLNHCKVVWTTRSSEHH